MDINKLAHFADFDFDTAALGTLRCGPTAKALTELDKMARANVDGEELARKLVSTMGRKLTGQQDVDEVAGGPSLTSDEVASLTKADLDSFCDKFVARRLRPTTDHRDGQDDLSSEKKPILAGCEGIGAAIIAHIDSQHDQLKRLLGDAHSNIMGIAAAQAMREFSLGDRFGKSLIGGALGEITEKMGLGSLAAQQRRDTLGLAAFDAASRAIKASDNLGEMVATMRATDLAVRQVAHSVEARTRTFDIPLPPPNPIHKTNELLRTLQDNAEEIRPTIIQTMELIQTLTDTALAVQALANDNSADAERQARRSMKVAIGSIVLSLITGGISIYYAYNSPTADQVDRIAEKFSNQMSAATTTTQSNREKYERQAAEDRAAFMKSIAQQSELIVDLKRTNEKHDQSKASASK